MLWRLIQAAAISALLMGTASAQNAVQQPDIVSRTDFPSAPLTTEDPRTKQARENAYRSALQKIPNKKNTQPVDPWANIRPNPPASSAAK